jgi:hypothetical protein
MTRSGPCFRGQPPDARLCGKIDGADTCHVERDGGGGLRQEKRKGATSIPDHLGAKPDHPDWAFG